VIIDRCLQAVTLNALEPEWEARFEPRSYGFRPGCRCHDAIGAIFLAAKGKSPKRQWVLDADLAAAFDRIDHDRLMASIGQFPARGLVEQWLKAGVIDRGVLAPTEEGVPQGGIISPALMNVALHGMEEAAGVRYRLTGPQAGELAVGSPTLIRYADDLVVLCHSRDEAQQVKERLARWLKPRGQAFNEDKTRIAHLDEGCDFLGFTVRRYHGMLLIKPSKASVRRIRARLTAEVLALRGQNAAAVIAKLNPIIRGWAAYFRGVVSSEVFASLDNHVWRLVYKWARHTHPNKPNGWVTSRYFGRFNESRQDRWVLGDRRGWPLSHHVRLDQDRQTSVGHQGGVRGRPGADRVLALAATQEQASAQSAPAASATTTARPVPALRKSSPARRPAAAEPPRMGAVAAGDPDGGTRERAHHRTERKPVRRSSPSDSPPFTVTSHSGCPWAFRACLSRMRLTPHVRF
jgi:group II intron reverse transcriptase/maturase